MDLASKDLAVKDLSMMDLSAMDLAVKDLAVMDESAMDLSAMDQSAMDLSTMDQSAMDLARSAVLDGDRLGGGAALRSYVLHPLDDVHALDHRPKHNVLAIQPGCLGSAEEELRPVGVLAGVGHRQNTGSGMLQLKVLIFKLVAVD